jgi:hypothetical protein
MVTCNDLKKFQAARDNDRYLVVAVDHVAAPVGVLRWMYSEPSFRPWLFDFFYRIEHINLPIIYPHSLTLARH